MPKALDAAYPRWTPALLKQLGIVAVGRYLSWLPNTKVITKAEYDGYLTAGVGVYLVWESTGRDYVGGYAAGHRDGAEARRQVRELGFPDERPIYWTIDTGAVFTQSTVDYARGFNEAGAVGLQDFYGDVEIGQHLLDGGLIRHFWQTNARAWPGDSTDSPRAAIIQRTSKSYPQLPPSSYDESDIFVADFGQHPRPSAPPAPQPVLPPVVRLKGVSVDSISTVDVTIATSAVGEPNAGDGWADVPGIAVEKVISWGIVDQRDPAASPGGYVPIPRVALSIHTQTARLIIEGGVPGNHYVVRVAHA